MVEEILAKKREVSSFAEAQNICVHWPKSFGYPLASSYEGAVSQVSYMFATS